MKAVNELQPEQYQLTEADYYRGVKTILNSEKAALAAAIALYDKSGTGKKAWKDPDFGPTAEDEHGALSLYYTGETPRDHPEVEDVYWHNPAEFIEEEDEEGNKTDGIHFMKGDAASNEVIQG